MCLKTLWYYKTVRSLSSMTSSQRKFRSCQSILISGFPLISAGRGGGATDRMNNSRSSSSFLSFFQQSLLSSLVPLASGEIASSDPWKWTCQKKRQAECGPHRLFFFFFLFVTSASRPRSSFSVAALHAGCHLGDNRGRERGCDQDVFRRSWWDGVVSGAGQHPEEHQLKGHH